MSGYSRSVPICAIIHIGSETLVQTRRRSDLYSIKGHTTILSRVIVLSCNILSIFGMIQVRITLRLSTPTITAVRLPFTTHDTLCGYTQDTMCVHSFTDELASISEHISLSPQTLKPDSTLPYSQPQPQPLHQSYNRTAVPNTILTKRTI
jgi:hypothetical protein